MSAPIKLTISTMFWSVINLIMSCNLSPVVWIIVSLALYYTLICPFLGQARLSYGVQAGGVRSLSRVEISLSCRVPRVHPTTVWYWSNAARSRRRTVPIEVREIEIGPQRHVWGIQTPVRHKSIAWLRAEALVNDTVRAVICVCWFSVRAVWDVFVACRGFSVR